MDVSKFLLEQEIGKLFFVRESSPHRRCPHCQSRMVRSGARSVFEDLAFTLGSDILRCGSCGGRFLSFLKFNIPARSHGAVPSRGDGFMVAWFAIFAGILSTVGIAFWTLHKFHRWPFS